MEGAGYWLKKHASNSGDKIALVEGRKSLNYKELNQRINRLTWVLSNKLKLCKGDRVAVLAFNCIEFVELYFATARLGIILVPLNIRLSVRELEFMLTDSGSKVLFVDRELLEQGNRLEESCTIKMITLNEEYEKLLASSKDLELTNENVRLEDNHLILYTSGTTGHPKGAVLTQANAFWNAINMQVAIGLTKNETTLTVLPLFHTGGIGLYMVPTLHQGGKVVIQRKFDPQETIELIEKENITAFFGVPAMFQALLESKSFSREKFSSIRNMMSGGAPLPTALIDRYKEKGLQLLQGYGCTETSPGILAMDEEAAWSKAGSVGKPLLYCSVAIFTEEGKEAKQGEIGEIWVKGGNVMQGYWQLPEATKEAFFEGWFKTGDLAKIDEDGYFFIAGRKKELIISGGENIYPAEVEDYLAGYLGVKEVAVLGILDEKWGEIPVAVIVPIAGKTIKKEDIQTYCQSGLARYKVPKQIFFYDEFPRNAAGKILKKELLDKVLKSLN